MSARFWRELARNDAKLALLYSEVTDREKPSCTYQFSVLKTLKMVKIETNVRWTRRAAARAAPPSVKLSIRTTEKDWNELKALMKVLHLLHYLVLIFVPSEGKNTSEWRVRFHWVKIKLWAQKERERERERERLSIGFELSCVSKPSKLPT